MMSSVTALIAPPLLRRYPYGRRNSFSLIEVIVAMAVVTFSIVLIVGLLALGLSNNHDSSERIQASNVASLLINTRRLMPTNVIANFGLPPVYQMQNGTNMVNISSNSATYVHTDGTTNVIASSELNTNVVYRATFSYLTNSASPNVANIDLVLWWPASLTLVPTNHPSSYYEVQTQITVPQP